VGHPADLVLFRLGESWTFRAGDSRSKSKNTPFDGWELQGRVELTISEGQVVYRG
jgi:dihydroorotase